MKITEIKENKKNPRVIKRKKLDGFVRSLVTFPEMMTLRPMVVGNDNVVLGGNMRLRALKHIKDNPTKVDRLIDDVEDDERKGSLRKYWDDFLTTGDVVVTKADGLTEEQRREFVIKDNVSFGEWDWDALANEWKAPKLSEWGIDLWNPEDAIQNLNHYEDGDTNNNPNYASIPPELLNHDITQQPLETIKGSDETPYERIIIVYKEEDKEKVAAMIGVDRIDKVVYDFGELKKN